MEEIKSSKTETGTLTWQWGRSSGLILGGAIEYFS